VTFERGDVVIAPFPFTDMAVIKRRPVVVLSNAEPFNRDTGQLVCAMVTGARKSSWPFDTAIEDIEAAGVRGPCVVRMKLVTLDSRVLGERCGRLTQSDLDRVTASITQLLNVPLATHPTA
jgi:mRNA interferase MazF